MFDLFQALYDLDGIRFGLWAILTDVGLSGTLAASLEALGFTVWEDFSVSR